MRVQVRTRVCVALRLPLDGRWTWQIAKALLMSFQQTKQRPRKLFGHVLIGANGVTGTLFGHVQTQRP